VACAAALANIGVIEARGLVERANTIGERAMSRLRALAERCELIGDVRGLGAMVGVELCHGRDPRRPASAEVKAIIERCRKGGLVVLASGMQSQVLRLLAPLVISDEDLERGLTILEGAILEVAGGVDA
jgi:4-aminobutyrate aminotransferase/(S)-3-amino-2-methylpropionate transaminase